LLRKKKKGKIVMKGCPRVNCSPKIMMTPEIKSIAQVQMAVPRELLLASRQRAIAISPGLMGGRFFFKP
jgi:hypothetical protein